MTPQQDPPTPPATPKPRSTPLHESKHRLAWSFLFLIIAAVAFFALQDPTGPRGLRAAKAWLVIPLYLLLLAALWIPPVGRALHRLFGS